mmetsp:Transcript_25498/g.49997  ORF Transcript_25498/g.49997 Transcript_25498/m.49997 type:complete len:476 (-) Transcript_25498:116-1543(-)
MVRLGRLSPSCTSRNRARLLAFRTSKETPSNEAVKEHWSNLGVDEKLAVLRLQDGDLVNELYEIQQSLYAADFECLIHGFQGQDQVRHKAGIRFFDVEGMLDDKGIMTPKAFIAHRAFVEMDNMFDFLEERLGRRFLHGVPPLQPKQWISLLTPRPTSWLDFTRAALKLVELALRKSQQDAAQKMQQECLEEAKEGDMEEPATSNAPIGMSQSAKRKARKKKAKAGLAAVCAKLQASASSHELLQTEITAAGGSSTDQVQILTNQDPNDIPEAVAETLNGEGMMPDGVKSVSEESKTSCMVSDAERVLSVSQSRALWEARIASSVPQEAHGRRRCRISPDAENTEFATPRDERSRTSSDSYDTEPVLTASQSLRQTAREARIGAVVTPALIAAQALRASAREAWVSAEIRMREKCAGRGRIRPPWMLADGSSGENWVDGFRAVIKNTFLDVEVAEAESSALRARSWPLCQVYGGA